MSDDLDDFEYTLTRRAIRQIKAEAKAEALREAASDPALRLSGHSGISITRLRKRADEIEVTR